MHLYRGYIYIYVCFLHGWVWWLVVLHHYKCTCIYILRASLEQGHPVEQAKICEMANKSINPRSELLYHFIRHSFFVSVQADHVKFFKDNYQISNQYQ